MKHFKLNKTEQRMVRISALISNITYELKGRFDPLKLEAILKRLKSALSFLSSRHHKRANNQLTIALALMKAL